MVQTKLEVLLQHLKVGLDRDRRPRIDLRNTMSMSSLGFFPFALLDIAGKRDSPPKPQIPTENTTAFPLLLLLGISPSSHSPLFNIPDSWTNFLPGSPFLPIRTFFKHLGRVDVFPILYLMISLKYCRSSIANKMCVRCLLILCGGSISFLSRPIDRTRNRRKVIDGQPE